MNFKLITGFLLIGILGSIGRTNGVALMTRIQMAKTSLEEYLEQCWNDFVDLMDNGIPGLNIPTFDPWFSNDSFPFRMQDSDIVLRADVNATNVTSLGFSSVEIPAVYDNGNGHFNISLTLSDLKINGLYSVVGSHHYFYPIVGNGPFDMMMMDVYSSGTATLMYNGTVYSLTKLELTPLLYGSATAEFFSLSISGTDSTSVTYTQIVNLMTELLWFQVEEELRLQLSVSITEYLNNQLLEFKPSSFLQKQKS
ncbi:uncharacterized protein LOC124202749 [Daphnia pulex]|uniref:uncharacterized protein LOC124202749 n=1 Tax=Daphnia pulex TaxID=6669 RepID=UPI001EDFB80D|nr:uncharacterized protein LOC124202749 [Daphnia pulex]XP_046455110.1 uncharacterized protein LOC124202749 [Daphnia pulex]XP_046455111.1 uncharacterized protein LOC124202749 [Daphnia pulex]